MDSTSHLIDQIYNAATDAAVWPDVVRSVQAMFRSKSVGIYCADMRDGQVSLVELRDIDPAYVRDYVDHYLCDNPWLAVPELQVPGRIRTDRSLDEYHNEPGYYRRTAFYNDWMRPQGFIHSLSTNLLSDGDVRTKFYMYRGRRPGVFTREEVRRFENVSGHLMRSVGIAYRLTARDARIAEGINVVDNLRFGVVLLDSGLRVIHANGFAEGLFRGKDSVCVREARIRTMQRDDGRALESAMRTALSVHLGWSSDLPQAVSVRRPGGRQPLRVMAIPLPRQANGLFLVRHAAVVLMISDPEMETVVPDQWLRHRYGFTGTESRLARSLVRGESLRVAAESSGLTYETARWYLKNIFQKTGTTRQSQLIRTLMSEQVPVTGGECVPGAAAMSRRLSVHRE